MEYAGKAGRPLDGLDVKSFFDGLVFFGPVALLVRTAAGVTVGQFFLLQAALACAALLSELPAGRLTDRIGYRNTLVLCEGLFLLARALLLTAFLCAVVFPVNYQLQLDRIANAVYTDISPAEIAGMKYIDKINATADVFGAGNNLTMIMAVIGAFVCAAAFFSPTALCKKTEYPPATLSRGG